MTNTLTDRAKTGILIAWLFAAGNNFAEDTAVKIDPVSPSDLRYYAQGKLVVGSGNAWKADYTDDTWKYLAAYRVADGSEAWRCDLKAFQYKSILNTLYFAGSFYAETQDGEETTSKLFRIDAGTGELLDLLDFGRPITSCATSIIAGGKIYGGDLQQDGIVVTRIAESATADWPGPFGDPQTNQMAAPREPNAKPVKMRELSPTQPH
jgi:hypothetical protein